MIIIDKKLQELEREGKPIRVGLIGAGFAGRGFALQIAKDRPGMRLVAIANRTIKNAKLAYRDAGIETFAEVNTGAELEQNIKQGNYAVTSDFSLLCESPLIDVIVEATGEVEFGAEVAMKIIKNKKHLVLINAELDGTVGPILKHYADEAGVVYTQMDGDQPGVIMNLYRYVEFLGFKPVMAGNIKSLLDHRRTPETQKEFAEKNFQRPKMITSFADGTKISFEMATVANATGFKVGKRGMYGPPAKHVTEAVSLFPKEELLNGGLVDYIIGAEPSFGVFILGYSNDPLKQRYMKIYKMGDGPLYVFYIPYHLSSLETPLTVARAVLFRDAALAPRGGLVAEVITMAKRDLKTGEMLDGIGGYASYGSIDNYETAKRENLLPMGLSEGCILKRDIKMDSAITYDDVETPKTRISDKLRIEQESIFHP